MNATSREAIDQHLSQIVTAWTMLFQARAGSMENVSAAQQRILERYSGAVYRYLLACVRDPDVADELFQEFGLRLARGDFKRADPERGRFRSFLKTTLYHLVIDHQRRKKRQAVPLDIGGSDGGSLEPVAAEGGQAESDEAFLSQWRAEVMARAWQALADAEKHSGQPLFTVLRLRTDHPDLRSPEMAERLTGQLGKPVTPEWVRKRLFQAREKFTGLLVDEVAGSLENPSTEEIADELSALGLLDYCRAALAARTDPEDRNTSNNQLR